MIECNTTVVKKKCRIRQGERGQRRRSNRSFNVRFSAISHTLANFQSNPENEVIINIYENSISYYRLRQTNKNN